MSQLKQGVSLTTAEVASPSGSALKAHRATSRSIYKRFDVPRRAEADPGRGTAADLPGRHLRQGIA